jgi:hypothetical protein
MKTLFRAERNEDIPSAHPQARRDQPAPGSYRELPDDFGRRCAAQACGNEVACAGGQDPTLEQRRARSGVVKIRTLWDLINERLGRLEGGDVAPKNQRLSPTLTNFFKLSLVRCLVILAGSS